MTILLTIFGYFFLLLVISRLTSGKTDNDTFYRGNRQSPWYMVAFGMIGASISGVTFVSVPGMVMGIDMTYMQTCLGFILGYAAVAFVLLPVFYRHNLTTIYSYLQPRLGTRSYTTGASFFILSKMTGAAARFYVVCIILQRFVLDNYGVPFPLTIVLMVVLIWLYTRRSGIKTLVWTDTLQTLCMFAALVFIILQVVGALGWTPMEAVRQVAADSHSRIFVFDDPMSRQYFWKQFLSGIFIVVVMTGLDQDMMQKNLTCKNLRDAQKDMCSYGILFIPANFLFLSLGVLVTMLYSKYGMTLPEASDNLLPGIIAGGQMGSMVLVLFVVGIIASAFSSADSALTALTTTFCIDILEVENPQSRFFKDAEWTRKKTHLVVMVVFVAFILGFKALNDTSVIDAIYTIAGYTYGPLLGLFAFGMFTRRHLRDRYVPFIAVASPLICYAIDFITTRTTGYRFGYELLMLNGALTFIGLSFISAPNQSEAH